MIQKKAKQTKNTHTQKKAIVFLVKRIFKNEQSANFCCFFLYIIVLWLFQAQKVYMIDFLFVQGIKRIQEGLHIMMAAEL